MPRKNVRRPLSRAAVRRFAAEYQVIAQRHPEVAEQFQVVHRSRIERPRVRTCIRWGYDPETGELVCLKHSDE